MVRGGDNWLERSLRWSMIALVLGWAALSVLASADMRATARLFSAIDNTAGHVLGLG
ncbi:MAG TPA: hypothetical protein VN668_01320 [Stellaceae bacterium]|nr:hypothetical protein [Stellaceae bacterium]